MCTWIFRARSTVNLSSSDNSSIPRIAMISWRLNGYARWLDVSRCVPGATCSLGGSSAQQWRHRNVPCRPIQDYVGNKEANIQRRIYNTRVQHTRLGVQGVDSGVNTQLGNRTRQHSGGIQVSEGSGRGRISQVISRHVDGLYGGD